MNKTILGISLFFILLFLYLYKKREHFFGDNVVYANNISSRCPADLVNVGSNSSSSSTGNERNIDTRMNIPLTDSSNILEQHPELTLPLSKTGEYMKQKYDMSAQDTTTGNNNHIIDVYFTASGKIGFKKSEIEQVYGEQLNKFKKKPDKPWEQEEYGIAKLMVPIAWKAAANQYGNFKTLVDDVKKIKTELNKANITLVDIDKELQTLQN